MLGDERLLERIEVGWRSAGLDPRRIAILAYAEKLTLHPGSMDQADVTALRGVGFSDEDVLHLAQCVAYYAYANRIADGLGVTLESDLES